MNTTGRLGNPLSRLGRMRLGAFIPADPIPSVQSGDYAFATTADAVVFYTPGGANLAHAFRELVFSYSGTPTTGNLTVLDGASVILSEDVTLSGRQSICFGELQMGSLNTSMTITLANGGTNLVGRIRVGGHRLIRRVATDYAADFRSPENSETLLVM